MRPQLNLSICTTTPQDLSFDEKLEKIQRYLPNGLTDKILAQRGKTEGERKQVTVMFCDMEGFTSLSERLDPEKEEPIKAYRVIAPSTRRTRFDVSAERGLTPFVGRERELELLLDRPERMKSGKGQAFSIMGEAGVGKSRLLYS